MPTTRAAVVPAPGSEFEIRDVELQDPRPDEALVRLHATGICHTDLSARAGAIPFPLPGLLGHEGVGEVVAVGDRVTRAGVGDRVLLTFTSCGRCGRCRGGHPAYCDDHLRANLLGGSRLDGSSTVADAGGPVHAHFFGQSSFAELALVDDRSMVRLPSDLTTDELISIAPLGCGVQTGAGAILNVLRPRVADTLVVAGAGAVGLSAVMAAAATGVRTIVAVDRVAARLDLALQLGATQVIDTTDSDLRAELAQLDAGRGPGLAIETTGSTTVLETMCDAVAVGGTCAVIGAPAARARAGFDVNALLPGRRIIGITLGDSEPETFVPQLIELYRAGRLPVDRLVRRYPFVDISRAARDAESGQTVKPVLVFDQPS